jgi:hypothetical protein
MIKMVTAMAKCKSTTKNKYLDDLVLLVKRCYIWFAVFYDSC